MTFRGDTVLIRSISIKGVHAGGLAIRVDIALATPTGLVLAVSSHDLTEASSPEIRAATKAFHDALVAHIETIHFDRPKANEEKRDMPLDIAQALTGADPSDRVAKQG